MKRKRIKNYQRSFTLMELIVVVAIIGILVAMVGIKMNRSIPAMKLDSATSQIREHIRLAQSRAKLTQVKHLIFFDTSNNRYGVYKSSKYPSDPIKETTSGKDISYDLVTNDQLKGGSIESINNFGGGGTGEIEFDARGQPHDGKGGSLINPTIPSWGDPADYYPKITVKYDSNSFTIMVAPITGNVSIQ